MLHCSFSIGLLPVRTDMEERRRDERIGERKQVVVTVLAAPAAREIEGRTFFCRTEDLSASGLRLRLHCAMPDGSALALRVAFSVPLKAFRLIGRSAWTREVDAASEYEVGVEFRDCPARTMSEWRDAVKVLLKGSAKE